MLRLLEEIWFPKLGSFFGKIFFTLEIFLKDIHIFLWFIFTPQSLLLLTLMKCPVFLKDLRQCCYVYWGCQFYSIGEAFSRVSIIQGEKAAA